MSVEVLTKSLEKFNVAFTMNSIALCTYFSILKMLSGNFSISFFEMSSTLRLKMSMT